MDIIKKLFSFNDDDKMAIVLCKFNDTFNRQQETKQEVKRQLKKSATITDMLKKDF